MDSQYKFINSVDPSKCRAKIKDKFSKLTLSSNKKKQEESEMQQEIHEKVVSKRISRNLLSELLTDDESDGDKQQQSTARNLLMRSDSSSNIGNDAHNASDTTHCSQVQNDMDKSLEMEPLMVSVLENTEQLLDVEDAVEKLSSRVSYLTMMDRPITVSSEDNPHDVSRIVSTEHQRIYSGAVSSPAKLRAEFKKEADVSIYIPASSSDDEDSDAPITISDSSGSEKEYEAHVSSLAVVAPKPSQDMDTVKANQMAAFLRDVRRNYGLPTDSPDREFEKRQREIATADTEPMTVDNDSRSAGTARRIATADTESMTEPTEPEPSSKNDSHRRLALDDTEDMTKLDESMQSSRHYNPVMKIGDELLNDSEHNKSSEPIPDDSLTIAETSEEEEENISHEEQEVEPQPTQTESALKRSESFSQFRSKSSSGSSSNDTQVQINISAKINIKIQVSQQLEDSGSTAFTDSFQSNDKSTSESNEEQLTHNSAHKASNNQSRAIEDIPHSPPERDIPQESPKAAKTPPPDFMNQAQRLLNELYGNTWKTPEVMRSLKKIPIKSSKRVQRPLVLKKPIIEMTGQPAVEKSLVEPEITVVEPVILETTQLEPTKSIVVPNDESVLADFSIFRRNIPQDLDSTRLPSSSGSAFKMPKENDSISKPSRTRKKVVTTEQIKPREVIKTRSGREIKTNWRDIIDSDTESEGMNASGDSDTSWGKPDKDDDDFDDDEDIENRKPPTRSRKNQQKTVKNDDNIINDGKEEIVSKKPPARRARKKIDSVAELKADDELVYLDLSKGEVEVQHNVSASPPANHDEGFNNRLEEILKTCRYEDKPKLHTPASKSKRKLFSALINEDLDNVVAPFDSPKERLQNIGIDLESVSISGERMPAKFEPFNKYLESVKTGKPIFTIQTPKANRGEKPLEVASPTRTPKSSKDIRIIGDISKTPTNKYGFLKSLDLCVGKSLCHPDALYYRDNFRLKREELATKLYELYNLKLFNNELNVSMVWNKKLTNTAGRCRNKKSLGERLCVIELSEKVLTSADRLRCTLIHELCHAATWVFNGEGGHGATWKAWACKANQIFPELPKIGVCHEYDIEYKYTYKCSLCGAKSHAHSKSKKVENIRCSFCHGAIEVYLNKKDKDGNTIMTAVREPTGFAKFVKDKYKDYKRPDLKHADVMKLLSNEFASMKVDGKA